MKQDIIQKQVHVTKIILRNFRCFRDTTIQFQPGLNMLVGDNEAGKSTLLEAVNLALTCRWQGRSFSTELSPHFINSEATLEFLKAAQDGKAPRPPELSVEVFLSDAPETAGLRGTNNSLNADAAGLRLAAQFDNNFGVEYAEFLRTPDEVTAVPTEFYAVTWYDFSGRTMNARALKVVCSLIDASRIRLQSGADYYLQKIIRESLEPKERAVLARTYRTYQQGFGGEQSITAINASLNARQEEITDKALTLEIDTSSSNQWDSALTPHLDRIPFQFAGSGEQNKLKILLALTRRVDDAHVILIEEPENHLSFTSLNQLVERIEARCNQRQIIISTHSSFVVNKLGLEQLILLSGESAARLTDLSDDTQDYFRKLSGYDTLRLVLAKAVILVEGPSDELVVQRAYSDQFGKRAIEDGIDVINVRGLSATRFLELSVSLKRRAVVVTDNDGNFANVDSRYAQFKVHDFVKICFSDDNSLPTLEPQMLNANGLSLTNAVLGRSFSTDSELAEYMKKNKTECALRFHDTNEAVRMPNYIKEAVSAVRQ